MLESPSVSLPHTPCSSTSQTSEQLSKAPKRRINKCDEVLDVIGKRLSEPSTIADKFTDIGKAWASKLRDLDSQQAVHAEKIINDVFYEAQLGNLNRNCSVQIPNDLYTRNALPPFNSQPLFNSQQSLHTQLTFINIQPPFTPFATQPNEKSLPPNNQTAAQMFHSFNDFMEGQK